MKKLAAAVVTIAALAIVPSGAVAQGTAPATTATFGNLTIHNNGKTASMSVRYRCDSGDTLWISAKQSKNGKKDPRLTQEGSSQIANAWLDSHRNPITCDGKSHTQTFSLDTLEPGTFGKLKQGIAWVQFCITDSNTDDLTLSVSNWVTVI